MGSDNIIRNTKLTDISPISRFSTVTKEKINYLFLNNNSITSVSSSLGFKNVQELRLQYNYITSLDGLNEMDYLIKLDARYNNLGKDLETSSKNENLDSLVALSQKSSLNSLDLRYNDYLVWIDYIQHCTGLVELYLENCSNFDFESVKLIKKIYNSIQVNNNSLDPKYNSCLEGDDIFN